MRKILLAIVLMVTACLQSFAQNSNDAAISNILQTMPAQNAEQLNKSMEAITALGENGITYLATWLKEKGDNTDVEYALGGYAYYVIQPGKQAQRATAVKAYCAALDKVAGNVNRQFIIKQLEQMGNDDAVPLLKKYLSDDALAGAAARALKQINTAAAKAALQTYSGDKVVIFQPADKSGIQFKTAALYKTTGMQGAGSLPLLQKAMKDNNAQYRQAVLWLAAKYQTPATNKQWLAILPTLSPEAQVQVIGFVAASKDAATLPVFISLLKNSNKEVRLAAIAAAGKVGNQQALKPLLGVMKKGGADEVAAVRDAILVMKGDGVMPAVTSAYNDMAPAGKKALLQVIAARSYNKALPMVMAQLESTNAEVAEAAGFCLPYVAEQKDLPALFNLLNNSNAAHAEAVQDAILAASKSVTDTLQKTGVIVQAMNTAPAGRKIYYYKLLAVTGGKASLTLIEAAWNEGDNSTKPAIISALYNSREARGERLLMKIAKEKTDVNSAMAVGGIINIISKSSFPPDEKLIMLKDAMPLATNDAQRKEILTQAGDCNTFLAMVFAGQYLDNTAVQQEAAHAVMDIALNHGNFNGEIVKNLLTKASAILNDRDADYERQAIKRHLDNMPAGEGFVSMFNGKDLAGWKGLVENPIARANMPADTLKAKQAEADKVMNAGWYVKDGYLVFSGHGENLCTVKQYADFDMYVDWKIGPAGDAGIYLRGSPQVQIWDTSRRNVGADVGSGGLYNNQKAQSKPLVLADNAINEWNSFHIIMRDDKVTVYLNGVLVTDNVTLENYWDRKIPIFPKEQIELQAHGNVIYYRDLYIKELTAANPVALSNAERRDGFTPLFDGSNLDEWVGDKSGYKIDKDGAILVDTTAADPGNMYTKDEFGNFVLRFQFMLTPGANNGIGIRAPLEGDAAYVGMEIQVLDNEAPVYKDLHEYQYHGSVYGVIPAKRGFLKPTGQWNEEEIIANGSHIKVTLNGEVILDGDIDEASKNGTVDHNQHPGLKRKTGHIGFLGHGAVVRFKNVRVKTL